jgi:pyruvate kinase
MPISKPRYEIIRKVEADLGRPIAMLADLQGPKLRVGVFAKGEEELVEGASFRIRPVLSAGRCDPGAAAAPRDLCCA